MIPTLDCMAGYLYNYQTREFYNLSYAHEPSTGSATFGGLPHILYLCRSSLFFYFFSPALNLYVDYCWIFLALSDLVVSSDYLLWLTFYTFSCCSMHRLFGNQVWSAYDVTFRLFYDDNVSFIYIEGDTDSHAQIYRLLCLRLYISYSKMQTSTKNISTTCECFLLICFAVLAVTSAYM